MSLIIATYNRSQVLRCAIESARLQTLDDWEMWVVGDACTDDTGQVVRAFDDPRIHFLNLPVNSGDQSGPNNEGVRRARGRFLAYLNHDDLWFPDHLETGIRALTDTGADLVSPLVVKLRSDGVFTCNDLSSDRRYAPHLSIPASFWVLRRELAEQIGPWRHHSECHATPSQEWLFRAFRAGKDLRFTSSVTALALPSGGRPGAYATQEFMENQRVLERIRNVPGFREQVLLSISEHYAMMQSSPPAWPAIENTARDIVMRLLTFYWKKWPKASTHTYPATVAVRKRFRRAVGAAGVHPEAAVHLLKYRRRGGFVRSLRQFRGLPAVPGDSRAKE